MHTLRSSPIIHRLSLANNNHDDDGCIAVVSKQITLINCLSNSCWLWCHHFAFEKAKENKNGTATESVISVAASTFFWLTKNTKSFHKSSTDFLNQWKRVMLLLLLSSLNLFHFVFLSFTLINMSMCVYLYFCVQFLLNAFIYSNLFIFVISLLGCVTCCFCVLPFNIWCLLLYILILLLPWWRSHHTLSWH